jgi:hypothetical protein
MRASCLWGTFASMSTLTHECTATADGDVMNVSTSIDFVDVADAIRAIDPTYVDAEHAGDAWSTRIHAVAWSAADERLYVIVADAFVFWTDDDFATLHEVREINRGPEGAIHPHGRQHLGAVVDTVSASVLVIGRDRRDGAERGVVWRKPAGARTFERSIGAELPWATTTGGNATAGYIGNPPREMIAFAVYESPAHFWYSLDDGISWRAQPLGKTFAMHVHEVYLHRSANLQRTARLWVSGGDDPSGVGSGVVTFDGVSDDGRLVGPEYVLRERPGYRLVGLAGDGKHVYVGNESLSGGILRILDNAQSIALRDFEYVLGKHRHDYHQFRSMAATADGLLAAASDSYTFSGDTIRADSGGFLYVSNDGGASFREISLGMKWITALVYDGRAFWIAGGMNREYGADPSLLRMTLLRVPKPGPYDALASAYCAKAVVVDSSSFYRMAGYAEHPTPMLAPGERTFRVDLSPYASIAVEAETIGSATLAVEALPFQNWHPDEDAWRDVATLVTGAAGRVSAMLPTLAAHNRWFRIRNAGPNPIAVRRLWFVGRR